MASHNPHSVKIARKRGAEDQEPPRTLIVQSGEGEERAAPAMYVRQFQESTDKAKRRDISVRNFGEGNGQHGEDVQFAPQTGPKNELGRRLFKLKFGNREVPKKIAGKRGRGKENVATFVEMEERQEKSSRSASPGAQDGKEEVEQYAGVKERPLKRPSRQPRMKKEESEDGSGAAKPQTEEEKQQLEELAQYLHEASLDELKMEKDRGREKQGMRTDDGGKVAAPKISGQRAKEMHRRRMESNRKLANQTQARQTEDADTEMSDGDYIYDTYILAPTPSVSTSDNSSAFDILSPHSSDIGYLIIAPEDKDAWEAYIDDLPTTSSSDASDSEDSNAEDYYGADYPEDELSEDDEFDRKGVAYGYRGGAGAESEGEGGGEGYESDDAAAWSEGEEEVERMMNPFAYRGPSLGGVRRRLELEDEQDV